MKLLLDFLPLLFFFGSFRYADAHKDWAAAFCTTHFGFMVAGGVVGPEVAPALLSTVVMMIATCLQVLILKLRGMKVDLMLWISFALVTVMGGATVYFHDPIFIMWKPSILYWAMGLAFWITKSFFQRNLLKEMIGAELDLPEFVWQNLHRAWVAFFAAMGVINLIVAYYYGSGPEGIASWTNFKVFGASGLMLLFTVGQFVYLSRHLPPIEKPAGEDSKDSAKP